MVEQKKIKKEKKIGLIKEVKVFETGSLYVKFNRSIESKEDLEEFTTRINEAYKKVENEKRTKEENG